MATITFTERDAEILYSIPRPGGTIAAILRCFVFLNRTSAPTKSCFAECITRALRVGCLKIAGENLIVADDWYRRIHAADDTAANEIDSMLEFQELLLATDWDVKFDVPYVFDEIEYGSTAEDANAFPRSRTAHGD